MSEVKRIAVQYDRICEGLKLVECEDGELIKYEDYAALKAERDALAAKVRQLEWDSVFIPKNLDQALTVMGVSLPVSKEEFNFEINRWIQSLVDRVIRNEPDFSAYANQLRAEGVMLLHKEQKEVALKNWQYDNFDALKRAAIRHCDEELVALICMLDQMEGFAANLRKENGNV